MWVSALRLIHSDVLTVGITVIPWFEPYPLLLLVRGLLDFLIYGLS